jgi:hypothetical protein
MKTMTPLEQRAREFLLKKCETEHGHAHVHDDDWGSATAANYINAELPGLVALLATVRNEALDAACDAAYESDPNGYDADVLSIACQAIRDLKSGEADR